MPSDCVVPIALVPWHLYRPLSALKNKKHKASNHKSIKYVTETIEKIAWTENLNCKLEHRNYWFRNDKTVTG